MCGIVALINGEKSWNKAQDFGKWFNQALYVDTLRGMDSTGLAAVPFDLNSNVKVIKETIPGFHFINLGNVQKVMENVEKYKYLIGHNRAATKGKASDPDNAHPFYVGDYVGVHNGTLHQHHDLCKGVTGTDSEAIYRGFDEHGVIKTLEKLRGAFALVWYDAQNESFNFIRNDERPLFYATLTDTNGLLLASEAGMLSWLAARNGLKVEKIHSVEVGILHTVKDTDVGTIEKTPVTLHKPNINYGGYYNNKNIGYDSVLERFKEKYKSNVINNEVIFKPISFVRYSNPSTNGVIDGKLYGELDFCNMFEGKKLKVKVYMIPEATANEIISSDCQWKGTITSIVKDFETPDLVLSLKASSISKVSKKKRNLPRRIQSALDLGCATCGDPLEIEDTGAWTSNNEPICKGCCEAYQDEDFLYDLVDFDHKYNHYLSA